MKLEREVEEVHESLEGHHQGTGFTLQVVDCDKGLSRGIIQYDNELVFYNLLGTSQGARPQPSSALKSSSHIYPLVSVLRYTKSPTQKPKSDLRLLLPNQAPQFPLLTSYPYTFSVPCPCVREEEVTTAPPQPETLPLPLPTSSHPPPYSKDMCPKANPSFPCFKPSKGFLQSTE